MVKYRWLHALGKQSSPIVNVKLGVIAGANNASG